MSALRFNGTNAYLQTTVNVTFSGITSSGQLVHEQVIFKPHSHPSSRSYIVSTNKFIVYHGFYPYYPPQRLVIGAFVGTRTWLLPIVDLTLEELYYLDMFHIYDSSSDTGRFSIFLNGQHRYSYTPPSPYNQLSENMTKITFGARETLNYNWHGTIQYYKHSRYAPDDLDWYLYGHPITYTNFRQEYPTVVTEEHVYDFDRWDDVNFTLPDIGYKSTSDFTLSGANVEVVASIFPPENIPYIANYEIKTRIKRKIT